MSVIIRVNEAKKLLEVPPVEVGFRPTILKSIKGLDYFQFCPTFWLIRGNKIKDRLEEKFGVYSQSRSFTTKLLTALFCDELIIILTFLMILSIMLFDWRPRLLAKAYQKGYHHINLDPFSLTCLEDKHQQCLLCNKAINYYLDADLHYQLSLIDEPGCDGIPSVYCARVNATGIDSARLLLETEKRSYLDEHSFFDDTYLVYTYSDTDMMSPGKFLSLRDEKLSRLNLESLDNSKYSKYSETIFAVICNRFIQGEAFRDSAKDLWGLWFAIVIFLFITLYSCINCLMWRLHNYMVNTRKQESLVID